MHGQGAVLNGAKMGPTEINHQARLAQSRELTLVCWLAQTLDLGLAALGRS